MKIVTVLSTLVKGKVLITALVGAALLGGTGIAMAATPTGNDLVQHITGVHATVTHTHQANKKVNDGTATPTANASGQNQKGGPNPCPGLPEAQKLAAKFALSTDVKNSSMQVICTLHDGTFQGTVDGKSVTTNHALGYGEIDQLLTYAQMLAKKNNETLTDGNVLNFVAMALKNCGSTAVAACVNTNQPPNGNGHGMSGGKPTAIPTPHAGGKPMGTPTPLTQK
jgi:hypothetical protein